MHTDQKAWNDYYMNKPTDATSWNPEEIISDDEQDFYDEIWSRLCGGLFGLVILIGLTMTVKGCM